MKKQMISLLLAGALLLALAACGNSEAPRAQTGGQAATVQDILDAAGGESEDAGQTQPTDPQRNQVDPALAPSEDVPRVTGDVIDLTRLSSTMIYSEVYNMMATPEDYVGKTVIMQGVFNVYEGEYRNYYACVVADASACCAQGIEFLLAGRPSYPEDYPEPYSNITVKGTFGTYLENDILYCQLTDAELTA